MYIDKVIHILQCATLSSFNPQATLSILAIRMHVADLNPFSWMAMRSFAYLLFSLGNVLDPVTCVSKRLKYAEITLFLSISQCSRRFSRLLNAFHACSHCVGPLQGREAGALWRQQLARHTEAQRLRLKRGLSRTSWSQNHGKPMANHVKLMTKQLKKPLKSVQNH